jgi:hypothetical protein
LDGIQRHILFGRLYLEFKAVVSRFSQLTHAIERHILEKRMSFSNLSNTISKLDSFLPSLPKDDKVAEIKRAKTNNKLFTMLPDDSSFLDFHVFEDLCEELKSKDLKSKMAAYKKFLASYCQRGIFECPSFSPTAKKGQSSFITEMHSRHYKMSLRELLSIEEQLCGILGVVPHTVSLCSNASKVASGNIQVSVLCRITTGLGAVGESETFNEFFHFFILACPYINAHELWVHRSTGLPTKQNVYGMSPSKILCFL